jgi:hypothetical protein
MAQNYKLLNTILLIIIAILCGEIYILNERLSEMSDIIHSMNEKINGLEELQKDFAKANLEKHSNLKDGNYTLIGITAIMLTVVALLYFVGIDPGSMANALNVSAEQATTETIGQNNLNSSNLIDCFRNIKDMNNEIIAQIDTKFEILGSKTGAVLNAITKGKSLNATLFSIRFSIEDFE